MLSPEDEMRPKEEKCGILLHQCSAKRIVMLKGVLADCMPPCAEWPWAEAHIFLGSHAGFNDRCRLAYFCLGNGMEEKRQAPQSFREAGVRRTFSTMAVEAQRENPDRPGEPSNPVPRATNPWTSSSLRLFPVDAIPTRRSGAAQKVWFRQET